MITKSSYEITNLLFNRVILDMEVPIYINGPGPNGSYDVSSGQPSEYILFVKDNSYYNGDLNNKLSLIIIEKNTGYVVNNNFIFNSLEVNDRKITIYRQESNKLEEFHWWFSTSSYRDMQITNLLSNNDININLDKNNKLRI